MVPKVFVDGRTENDRICNFREKKFGSIDFFSSMDTVHTVHTVHTVLHMDESVLNNLLLFWGKIFIKDFQGWLVWKYRKDVVQLKSEFAVDPIYVKGDYGPMDKYLLNSSILFNDHIKALQELSTPNN